MTNSKNKGFLVPLIAVGALAIAGLGGGGCGSDEESTDQPVADAGPDTTSKGGSTGKGGSGGSVNCGTAEKCDSKEDCWPISCTCSGGKKIDIPATCNNGCCLELVSACKEACANAGTGGTTGQGGTNQGGANQGGASQGGANQGGASQGGATNEGGANQGGATNEGGASQGGATNEGGASQGGATNEGGASQGGASGEGGAAQGGAAGEAGAAGTAGSGGSTTSGLVINEVDYDQVSPPSDAAEFIEILNTSSAPITLDGISVILANGGSSPPVTYMTVDLTGTLNAGAYLLVHGPTYTPPATCGLTKAMVCAGDADCIQNAAGTGTAKPDSILLVRMATSELLDAVSYEGCLGTTTVGSAQVATCEGSTGAPADSNTEAASISRLPVNGNDTNDNAVDFKYTKTPTPCAANVP